MTTASEVIQQHAALADRWRSPAPALTGYISAFVSDVVKKRGAVAGDGMFWPMETSRITEPWVRLIGMELYDSQTFQVTGEMCGVVSGMYRKNRQDVTRISISELPADRGLVWLDEPPDLHDKHGKVSKTRAVSWAVTAVPCDGRSDQTALRLIMWCDTHVDDDYSEQWLPGVLQKSERAIGRLQLQHSILIPLDRDVQGVENTASPLADDSVAWVHVLLMLLGTTITSQHRAFLPRSTEGNVKRALKKKAVVTIITLRRAAHEHSGATRDVDWSCRWVVQGHHRHLESYDINPHHAIPLVGDQKHCAACRARITWVAPYVKGPDDAPLKVTPVVHRLSR
jgi:hypothetical protein